jgi:two-component system response regulator (stage 0 sporulation protein F)
MPRILMIDDDEAVHTTITAMLAHWGFDVRAASTGRAGLHAIATSVFDAVIVDIFMPDMGGIETIQEIHKINASLPVIAISGFMFRDAAHSTPDFLTMSTRLGAVCCLRKPFRSKELLQAIELCLGDAQRKTA